MGISSGQDQMTCYEGSSTRPFSCRDTLFHPYPQVCSTTCPSPYLSVIPYHLSSPRMNANQDVKGRLWAYSTSYVVTSTAVVTLTRTRTDSCII